MYIKGRKAVKNIKYLSNIHTHTILSDGVGTLEENIETAISKGFVSLGISDHSYTSYDEETGIDKDSEESYAEKIREAKKKYADKIELFCGTELDSFSTVKRELYDYVICSVHALKIGDNFYSVDYSEEIQDKIIAEQFGGDVKSFAKTYYNSLAEHVMKNSPDVVGHFDLITKYGNIDESDSEYRRIAIDALHKCAESCSLFEVNTGAMARGYRSSQYPAEFLLEEILKIGGSVIVTSDSHRPEQLDFAFDKTYDVLRKIGFTSVKRLTKDGFVSDSI